jgi:hypothetical protein
MSADKTERPSWESPARFFMAFTSLPMSSSILLPQRLLHQFEYRRHQLLLA